MTDDVSYPIIVMNINDKFTFLSIIMTPIEMGTFQKKLKINSLCCQRVSEVQPCHLLPGLNAVKQVGLSWPNLKLTYK